MEIDPTFTGMLSAAGAIITALWFAWRDSLKQKDALQDKVYEQQKTDLKGLYDATNAIANTAQLLLKITVFIEQHGRLSETIDADLENIGRKLDSITEAVSKLSIGKNG